MGQIEQYPHQIAHNVIPSGLLPKNMGYTDEAYRDTTNVFGKGFDAMHITGDLSLADFATIEKNHGRTYPKLADYLPGTHPASSQGGRALARRQGRRRPPRTRRQRPRRPELD